jgi:hypothetical protein
MNGNEQAYAMIEMVKQQGFGRSIVSLVSSPAKQLLNANGGRGLAPNPDYFEELL